MHFFWSISRHDASEIQLLRLTSGMERDGKSACSILSHKLSSFNEGPILGSGGEILSYHGDKTYFP